MAGEYLRTSKPAIFVELALATGLCFARVFPFSIQVFLIAFASLSLWLRGMTWRSVGLERPKTWWKVALLAALSAIAINVVVNLLLGPYVEQFAGKPAGSTRFDSIRGNLIVLVGWLCVVWTLVAFGEEAVFRGYLMNRISDLVGTGRVGWILSLLGSSLIFGAGHAYQGLAGAIGAAEIGFLLGILYLLNKRNLWMNIVCHGFIDSISLTSLYLSAAL